MLEGGKTIDEIIEYFKNYSVEDGRVFETRFYRSNRSSRQSSMEPDEDSYNSSTESNLKSFSKKSFSKTNPSSRLLNVPQPHELYEEDDDVDAALSELQVNIIITLTKIFVTVIIIISSLAY